MDPKNTPLSDSHIQLGAKMVNFAGWYMPVEYMGLRKEHLNVRQNVGLFDVSHMGEIFISGDNSLETVQWLTTNDVSKLNAGKAQYSLMLNEEAGVVDDLIVYCLEKEKNYLLCVNASNIEKDFQWMLANNKGANIENKSEDWGQIAVQGPKSVDLIKSLFGLDLNSLKNFEFVWQEFENEKALVAKTGYTGEAGCEVYLPKALALRFWQLALDKGQAFDVLPIGLGARDTLRLEKTYCLYGHELNDKISPFEAGLNWVVKAQTKDFIGKHSYLKIKEQDNRQKLVGLELIDKGIARENYPILFSETPVGFVTSGTLSPSLNKSICLAYVDKQHEKIGTELDIQIRSRKVRAKVIETPFV